MLITTKAIVISSLKFGDADVITKCFTLSDGIKSYLLKNILKSKRGKLKIAYFQPLNQLEIVANHKNKGTLEYIKEVKSVHPYHSIPTNIKKSAIVLFLSEILAGAIREEEENVALFQYITYAFLWLDNSQKTANFHLFFILQLTKYLGFYPDQTHDSDTFDLLEGKFITEPSANTCITGENLTLFKRLLGTEFDAQNTLILSSKKRAEMLKIFIQYFKLHLHGFKDPKSIEVLHEVFN